MHETDALDPLLHEQSDVPYFKGYSSVQAPRSVLYTIVYVHVYK